MVDNEAMCPSLAWLKSNLTMKRQQGRGLPQKSR
jgi:hypothetical protein